MKYIVGAVMIIYVLFMAGTVSYGFLQKQQKEAQLNNTLQTTPPQQTQQSQPTDTISPSQPAQQTSFSVAEVAKHNKPNDCWIIISAKVYDVGKFLDLHPGGADVIVPFCGKDATAAFANQGGRGKHSSQALQELQNYLIGTAR